MPLRPMHLLALLFGLLVAGPAPAQGRWSQMKPIPQGEEEVVGVAVDGRMYVMGGGTASRSARSAARSTR